MRPSVLSTNSTGHSTDTAKTASRSHRNKYAHCGPGCSNRNKAMTSEERQPMTIKQKPLFIAAVVFAYVLGAMPVLAQTSAVSGHVVDSDGLPIQGALVDIVSAQTGEVHNTQTNSAGYYLFPPLNPGSYVIHVTAPNLAKATIDQITLEVGSSRAIDVELKPAGVSEDVTVTASAPELVTTEPDRGSVIE